jgi:hypothetical protein
MNERTCAAALKTSQKIKVVVPVVVVDMIRSRSSLKWMVLVVVLDRVLGDT